MAPSGEGRWLRRSPTAREERLRSRCRSRGWGPRSARGRGSSATSSLFVFVRGVIGNTENPLMARQKEPEGVSGWSKASPRLKIRSENFLTPVFCERILAPP
jgi:hypothetical protein